MGRILVASPGQNTAHWAVFCSPAWARTLPIGQCSGRQPGPEHCPLGSVLFASPGQNTAQWAVFWSPVWPSRRCPARRRRRNTTQGATSTYARTETNERASERSRLPSGLGRASVRPRSGPGRLSVGPRSTRGPLYVRTYVRTYIRTYVHTYVRTLVGPRPVLPSSGLGRASVGPPLVGPALRPLGVSRVWIRPRSGLGRV